jgi:hypothetical protein
VATCNFSKEFYASLRKMLAKMKRGIALLSSTVFSYSKGVGVRRLKPYEFSIGIN